LEGNISDFSVALPVAVQLLPLLQVWCAIVQQGDIDQACFPVNVLVQAQHSEYNSLQLFMLQPAMLSTVHPCSAPGAHTGSSWYAAEIC
jgi:hypothetical protein